MSTPTAAYLKRYGLTEEDCQRLWDFQEGRCATCLKKFTPSRLACVDHNHLTGHVRGLLCRECNYTLGVLNEDAEWLRLAVLYLTTAPADFIFDAPRKHKDAPPWT